MSLVSNNIKLLRKKHHYTQEQFAQQLGIKRSLLGAYEEARAMPRLEVLVKAASLFNVSVDQLVAEDLRPRHSQSAAPSASPKTAMETSASELEPDVKREPVTLELVTQQEHAAYFQQREDKQYLAALPDIRLLLNNVPDSTYRAFEIADDAMYPVVPGTIVIGKRLENLQEIQDNSIYVLITRTEGILLRRVFNHIQEKGTLQLHTTSATFEPMNLSVLGKEVEVWEVVAYISRQMPFANTKPTHTPALDMQQLTAMVLELQQELEKLKGEMTK